MTDFVFTPEDFKRSFSPPLGDDDLQLLADDANAKLKEWIEKAPMVFQRVGLMYGNNLLEYWNKRHDSFRDTHRARLVCLEEIPK